MKKYFRKAAHYFAGNLFNKIILLIFLPIFTRFMLPAEYAVYSNFLFFVAVANLFYLFGLEQAVLSYFHESYEKEYRFTLISSIFLFLIFIGTFFSLIILVNAKFIAELVVRDPAYSKLIPQVVIIILTGCIYGLTLTILIMMERSLNYAILGGIKNFLLLILFLFGALTKKFDVNTVFNYMMISSIVSVIFALGNIGWVLKKFSTAKNCFFSWKLLRPLLKFGVVMVPGTLAALILRVMDRYMLTYLSKNGLHDAGIYSTGYRIGMIMQFLVTIVSLIFVPYAMRIAEQPQAKRIYRKIFNYFLGLGSFLAISIILFTNEIFALFIDPRYFEAKNVVFAGVISVFLLGIFNIIKIGFYIKKDAKKLSLSVVIGAVLNLFLNYLFIPKYGIYGAAITSIISYLFIVIMMFISVEKQIKIGFDLWKIFFSLLLIFVVTFFSWQLQMSWKITLYKVIGILIILVFLFLKQKNKWFRFRSFFGQEVQ